VYRVLIAPDEVLGDIFRVAGKEQMATFYRKLAIQIHPDKNGHPHAQIAFQKLATVFEAVKRQI